MPRLAVGTIQLHYDLQGNGEPLLLIMGFGLSSASWRPEFLAGLAPTFRVITFDNRGTGRSDQPDNPVSIALLADDAAALLDTLGIARAHVLGVSMGGSVAQEFALNHPQRLAGLVLGCAYCGDTFGIHLDRRYSVYARRVASSTAAYSTT